MGFTSITAPGFAVLESGGSAVYSGGAKCAFEVLRRDVQLQRFSALTGANHSAAQTIVLAHLREDTCDQKTIVQYRGSVGCSNLAV